MKIFIAAGGETLGPFTADEVRQSIKDGDISPEDLGCRDGESEWFPISEILDQSSEVAHDQTPRNKPNPTQKKPQRQAVNSGPRAKLDVVNLRDIRSKEREDTVATVTEHLGSIRGKTCYPQLRGLINALTLVAITVFILTGFFALFGIANEYRALRSETTILPHVLSFLSSVMGVVGSIAARQGAFVLIDIADVLISDSARKK